MPDALKILADSVDLLTMNPAPEGKESLLSDIQKAAELSMDTPDYRKTIIDEARSGKKTKQQIFDELNKQWAQGVQDAG